MRVVFAEDLSNAIGREPTTAWPNGCVLENMFLLSVDKVLPEPRMRVFGREPITRDQPRITWPDRRHGRLVNVTMLLNSYCLSLCRCDDEIVVLLIQRCHSACSRGAGCIKLATPQRISLSAALAFVHGCKPET